MTEQEAICKSFVNTSLDGILGSPFITIKYHNGSEIDKMPRASETLVQLIMAELNNSVNIKMVKEIQIKVEKDDKVYFVNSIEIE